MTPKVSQAVNDVGGPETERSGGTKADHGVTAETTLSLFNQKNENKMPINPAVLAAAGNVVSTGIGAISQGATNAKQRRWNEKMFNWQRNASLADWHMQNEYNSPTAQMARLREAGLNPHLVYGGGATTEAGAVKPSSAPGWNPKAPDFSGLGNSIFAYQDAQIKTATLDNLKAQNTVMVQDALLRAAQVLNTTAQTAKTGVDTELGRVDLSYASQLKEMSLEAMKAGISKTGAETTVLLNRDEREAALNSSNLKEAAQRILSMRIGNAKTQDERRLIEEQIKNLQQDQRLKKLDEELKIKGIQPNDPAWMRVLLRLLNRSDSPEISDYTPLPGSNPIGDFKKLFK